DERLALATYLRRLDERVLELGSEIPQPVENTLAALLERLRLSVQGFVAFARIGLNLLGHRLGGLSHGASFVLGSGQRLTALVLGLAPGLGSVGVDRLTDVARVIVGLCAYPFGFARQLLDTDLGVGLGAAHRVMSLTERIRTDLLGRLLGGFENSGDAGADVAGAVSRLLLVASIRFELSVLVLGTPHPLSSRSTAGDNLLHPGGSRPTSRRVWRNVDTDYVSSSPPTRPESGRESRCGAPEAHR